ncbi:MAG: O-antigen ligase family protein [Isosphaeraceae bacterium]
MNFFLLIVVTGLLFVRPTDFIRDLESAQLFLLSIIACLAASIGVIPAQLAGDSLRRRPVTACVLALLPVQILSCLANLQFDPIITGAFEFSKVVLLYLLLIGLVRSPGRLKTYLTAILYFLTIQTGLAVLQYYKIIDLPAFMPLGIDPATGEQVWSDAPRLRGTGLFGDPNDISLLIDMGIILSLQAIAGSRGVVRKLFWMGPLAMFALALRLTGSRGGLAGALGGLAVLLVSRFGLRKGLIAGALAIPLVVGFVGGRQTDFNVGDIENTGLKRIQLWSNALELFKGSPFLGVGPSRSSSYLDDKDIHNSFIQAYSDLGFLGGTAFFSAFAHLLGRLYKLQHRPARNQDATLTRMRPYVTALLAAYAITAMTVNFTYIMSTYVVLGIGACHVQLSDADRPPPGESLGGALLLRWALSSLGFLVLMYGYIKLTVKY